MALPENEAAATVGQIFVSFTKMGAMLFGGGYAMLPLLEREVIARRKWCREEEMADYYAMAQLVPGVLAINTSMLIGHHLRGFRGTLAAAAGMVAVPFVVILAYALAFDRLSHVKLLADAMAGLRPAVAGMMAGVAFAMFRRTRRTRLGLAVALVTLVLILGCGVSAALVIVAGVAAGVLGFGVAAVRKRGGAAQ